jgi:daunorubicin resistance ABC transporter ATP-binding subunit
VAAVIEVEGLVKRFGDVVALDGIDLRVDAGGLVGLLGPNGAGKTTTINVLSTLLLPDAGVCRVGGCDVVDRPDEVRSLIGLTGQFAALDEQLTGRENLVLFGRLLKLGRSGARRRAAELLDRFELRDAAHRRVATYSGGMRRRLDLAASLVGEPRVLFLDEPTTGLDPRSRRELWDVVGELRAAGATILLTTQYLEEADRLADRIVVVDGGVVVVEGTPAELKARVGGSVCEVAVADAGRRAVASAALDGLGEVAEVGDRLTVPAEGTATLTEVVRRLDAAGVVADDIALRRPTLDDVFLALTGHTAGRGDGADADDDRDRTPEAVA